MPAVVAYSVTDVEPPPAGSIGRRTKLIIVGEDERETQKVQDTATLTIQQVRQFVRNCLQKSLDFLLEEIEIAGQDGLDAKNLKRQAEKIKESLRDIF